MAKKICEDWASILLNEKTVITIDDNASNTFLQGEDGAGGVLGAEFWRRMNELIELAYMSGTGAIVMHLGNIDTSGAVILQTQGARIDLQFVDALHIIPISVSKGIITEAAFCSQILQRGKLGVYMETHTLEHGKYVIQNEYLSEDAGGALTPSPLPQTHVRKAGSPGGETS